MRSARPLGCIDFNWFVSGQGRQSARWPANIASAVRAFVLRPSSDMRAEFRAVGRAGGGGGKQMADGGRLYLAKKKKKKKKRELKGGGEGDVFPLASCLVVCGPDQ